MTSDTEFKHDEVWHRNLTFEVFDSLKERDPFYADRYLPRSFDNFTGWRSGWYFGRHREEEKENLIPEEVMRTSLRNAIRPD